MRFTVIAAAAATLIAASSIALADQSWSHKAWSVSKDGRTCTLRTGGDGDGFFSLTFATGGFDPSAVYRPLMFRGYPPPLDLADEINVVIDGKTTFFGEEMGVYDGTDEYGDYFRAAGLTAGFVPDLADALRKGNTIAFQRVRPEETRTIDALSLSGFTAALLKASDWCKFDAKKLPRS